MAGLNATPAKCDEEKEDTTGLAVKDDVSPQRAPLEDDASLRVDEEEPSDRAVMEVESAIAAIAATATTECRMLGNERSLQIRFQFASTEMGLRRWQEIGR